MTNFPTQVEVDKSSGRYRPSHGYNHHVHPRPHHHFDYDTYDAKPVHSGGHVYHHQHHRPPVSDLKPVIVPGISLDGYDKVIPIKSKYRKVDGVYSTTLSIRTF